MKALAILQAMDYECKRDLYKGVPNFAIPKSKFSDKTSNGLTQCILTWLRLQGHYATRINTTGRKLKDTVIVDVVGRARTLKGQWIPGSTRKGTADIIGSIHGKHVSIEIKIGKDKPSKEQEDTRHDIESDGGYYFIAQNFQTFYEWYQSKFIS